VGPLQAGIDLERAGARLHGLLAVGGAQPRAGEADRVVPQRVVRLRLGLLLVGLQRFLRAAHVLQGADVVADDLHVVGIAAHQLSHQGKRVGRAIAPQELADFGQGALGLGQGRVRKILGEHGGG